MANRIVQKVVKTVSTALGLKRYPTKDALWDAIPDSLPVSINGQVLADTQNKEGEMVPYLRVHNFENSGTIGWLGRRKATIQLPDGNEVTVQINTDVYIVDSKTLPGLLTPADKAWYVEPTGDLILVPVGDSKASGCVGPFATDYQAKAYRDEKFPLVK